jgi:hypothetical protein
MTTLHNDLTEQWPYETIGIDDDEAIADVLRALQTELDELDGEIQNLRDQRFVDTATGPELEKLGAEVGVVPETGESEDRYRYRVRLGKAIADSDGTLPTFAQILHVALGEDATSVSLAPVTDEPAVQLSIPSDVINDLPVTQSELEGILVDALPDSDGLNIITDDTWLLGESGSQGLGKGGLS